MIILFGLAGSGKSTQGNILAEKYGWRWLSVGQVLRDTGRFDQTLREGGLVDDNEVIRLMNKEIQRADDDGIDVILDGYPRDEYQAKWVAENMADRIDGAIWIKISKEELWKRIELRGREDDTKDAVERRFKVVEQNICSISNLLKAKNVQIVEVDGFGKLDEVTERLSAEIEKMMPEAMVQENDVNDKNDEKSYGE